MSDQIDYDELRTKVEAGLQRQKKNARVIFFIVNLMMLALFTGISATIAEGNEAIAAAFADNQNLAVLLMLPYMGWIMGLVFQGISLALDSAASDKQLRGQIIARELGEQMLKLGEKSEKAKRNLVDDNLTDGEMVIGDDGELKYFDDERSQQRISK